MTGANGTETKLQACLALGQSIWLDFIRRDFTRDGSLARLVQQGLRGVTSNPTIFEKAITGSPAYDDEIAGLAEQGLDTKALYEALAIRDVGEAADALAEVHANSGGGDGFVSLEVSPELAHDRGGTVLEALRLYAALNRTNVMIKVPATSAGILALEDLTAEGVPVNLTLIFGAGQAVAAAKAYRAGLVRRRAGGHSFEGLASVASLFISRVDAKAGARPGAPKALGVANARAAYAAHRTLFEGPEWQELARAGAHSQRLLWASTGVKDPSLPDTFYVDELIGPDTVNTVPPATLEAFMHHGRVADRLLPGLAAAAADMESAESAGIDRNVLAQELLNEGLRSFQASFAALLQGLETKLGTLKAAQAAKGGVA